MQARETAQKILKNAK